MRTKFGSIVGLAALLTLTVPAAGQDPHFHIYLCFGQSNMEGAGRIEEQDKTVDERFQILQAVDAPNLKREKGRWYPAVPPLVRGRTGIGPADYFGRASVPLLAGELVNADQNGACASMNRVIAELPKAIPNAHVISSAGLPCRPDRLHFTTPAYREFGKRYAEKMVSIMGIAPEPQVGSKKD